MMYNIFWEIKAGDMSSFNETGAVRMYIGVLQVDAR